MSGAIIITGKDNINAARWLVLKAMLSLECKGMARSKGKSAYTIIKNEFGLKGNKQKVLAQFIEVLKTKKILQ